MIQKNGNPRSVHGSMRRVPISDSDIAIKPSRYIRAKRPLDLCLAILLLIPGLPLLAMLVGLVRLTSRGPGIFRQTRVGLKGHLFTMYKLRSMRIDAEAKTGPVWTSGRDPRVTWIGHWLRKLHLDELPQLFNVLKGDMSLIGPRPERPEFVEVLRMQIPGYVNRLAVLPGVTGLAQINLPPDTDLNSVRRKQQLDLEYIQIATPWLDVRMFLATVLRMFGLHGETVIHLMRLRRTVQLPEDETPAPIQITPTPATLAQASSNGHEKTNGKKKRTPAEREAELETTDSGILR